MNKLLSRHKRVMQSKASRISLLSQRNSERTDQIKSDLQGQSLQGEKAKIILDYAEKVLFDAENYALNKLCLSDTDVSNIRAEYRAAVAFYQKINDDVRKGLAATSKLRKMQEQEKRE